jgi:hypothetical protein
MKTKSYEFTESEIFALKMATENYFHIMKIIDPKSPVIIRMKSSLNALKDQFNDDYRLWK